MGADPGTAHLGSLNPGRQNGFRYGVASVFEQTTARPGFPPGEVIFRSEGSGASEQT